MLEQTLVHAGRSEASAASTAQLAAALPAQAGEFAVAQQDADGRLLAAVDRFASHSLCWREQDGLVKVAERADTLAGPDAPLDPQALFDYLFFHVVPAPRTVFKGVQRLPAAHQLLQTQAGSTPELSRYWTPRFSPRGNPSFDTLKAEFLRLVEASVGRALDGAAQGSCYLSGGTDSSTVAGMIRRITGQGAAAYSIGFAAEGYDEMAYARLAAQHFGAQHHELYVTPEHLIEGMPKVAGFYDQPFGNSSAVPAYFCALRAHDDGHRLLLAGDGGDELFGGNARYAKHRLFEPYAKLPSALRTGLLEPWLLQGERGNKLTRKAASYVDQARVPLPHRMDAYNLLVRIGIDRVLSPAFLAQIDRQAPSRLQGEVWAQAQAEHRVDRHLAFDWRFTLAETDLPKVRGSAALAGMAVRFPLLDQALLEFSMHLPPHYKLRGNKLRWFFKEALRGFLPDAILSKRKQGFGLPFGVWAVQHAGLREASRDCMHSLNQRGLLRAGFAEELLNTVLPTQPGYYGEMLWILSMLEYWLRAHRPDWKLGA